MPIPEDHELRDIGVALLEDEFDDASNLVIESIESTYHNPDWTASAQVYDQQANAYIGVIHWSGCGEEVDDPSFEKP